MGIGEYEIIDIESGEIYNVYIEGVDSVSSQFNFQHRKYRCSVPVDYIISKSGQQLILSKVNSDGFITSDSTLARPSTLRVILKANPNAKILLHKLSPIETSSIRIKLNQICNELAAENNNNNNN